MTTPPVSSPEDVLSDWAVHVRALDARLDELDQALRGQSPDQVEAASRALQQGLAQALAECNRLRQCGHEPLTPQFRQSLSLAQMRITTLQSAVHRAGASVQRTLGILFQDDAGAAPVCAPSAPSSVAAAALNAYRG